MILIDHWKCTSCSKDFESSTRMLEDLRLIPECPRCGSTRIQVKLRMEMDEGERSPLPRKRGGKIKKRSKPEMNAPVAWKGGSQ